MASSRERIPRNRVIIASEIKVFAPSCKESARGLASRKLKSKIFRTRKRLGKPYDVYADVYVIIINTTRYAVLTCHWISLVVSAVELSSVDAIQ